MWYFISLNQLRVVSQGTELAKCYLISQYERDFLSHAFFYSQHAGGVFQPYNMMPYQHLVKNVLTPYRKKIVTAINRSVRCAVYGGIGTHTRDRAWYAQYSYPSKRGDNSRVSPWPLQSHRRARCQVWRMVLCSPLSRMPPAISSFVVRQNQLSDSSISA